MNFYRRHGKRLFDVVISAAFVVVCAPAFAALAAIARVYLGSPIIFRQARPGRDGIPFDMYKLRTMTEERDSTGELLPDSRRLTPLGKWLRSSSLDELPGLYNVLKGQMSLVGPRPLLMKYQPYFSAHERKRFGVRPGITGWAQVNGRNALRWGDRLACDVWYAENVSLRLDLVILVKTFLQAIRREGVEVDPRSVMQDLDAERSAQAVASPRSKT